MKNKIINTTVILNVHFSIPRLVENISPWPPQALPRPDPFPCININTTIKTAMTTFINIKKSFIIVCAAYALKTNN